MSKDQGIWTYEDSALVLIDYQKEMFENVRSETSADLIDLNVRLLIKAAKAFNIPIDRKSTRLNSSHVWISYAVCCLKKKNTLNCAERLLNKYDLKDAIDFRLCKK